MKNTFHRLAAALALGLAGFTAQATPVVVDVSGAQSINMLGESGNTVWLVNVGAGAVLNSLSWDVSLNALDPSLLSEMLLSFGSSGGLDQLSLAVADGDFSSGAGSYSGSVDLSALAMSVGSDGLLRLEFSDSYKDFATDVAEGEWLRGTLTFDVSASAVPEPASAALALAALGLLGIQQRRRAALKR